MSRHNDNLQMDYDMVDYLNELRDACLEAYTGILQGLRGPDSKNFSRQFTVLINDLLSLYPL